MEFPSAVKEFVLQLAESYAPEKLRELSENLSRRYQQQSGRGASLVTSREEALVYALVRMPATFGAAAFALEQTLPYLTENLHTLLDVGAGTGAGSWAAQELLPLKKITCLEKEPAMYRLGQQVAQQGSTVLSEAQWVREDIVTCREPGVYDLVMASYVLNELTLPQFEQALQSLWKATGKVLLLMEPGTPQGFQRIKAARQLLREAGGYVASPCPHQENCSLAADDWCHFSVRVQRSRLHRLMKSGDVPYEDEKFSYIAITRQPPLLPPAGGRVLRHPQIGKGHIGFTLCTPEGVREVTVTKKQSGYHHARKTGWGDFLAWE